MEIVESEYYSIISKINFQEISVFSQSFYESVLSKCTRNESKLNHEDGDDTQTAAGKVDVNGFHSDVSFDVRI